MLLKVLIVDDDAVARTHLKTLIDWEKNGYVVCGEAQNGMNAIHLIRESLPDIVVTDMSMPVMNGVALIEYIADNHPAINTIALSGYDDFDYVRQSMKYGAVDYLLKYRLSSESLLAVLSAARDSILRDRDAGARKQLMQERLSAGSTALKKDFIRRLLFDDTKDIPSLQQEINLLGLELDTRNLAVVAFEIDDYQMLQEKFTRKEMGTILSSIEDMTVQILKDSGKSVASHIDKGKFVIIFSFGSIHSDLFIYNQMLTSVDRIKVSIKRYLNITASFSVGKLLNNIAEIGRYYQEADLALRDKFYKGKDNILRESSIQKAGKKFTNLDIQDEKCILHALKAMDRKKLSEHVDRVFEKMLENEPDYKSTQMICVELINILNRVAREISIDIGEIYTDEDIPYDEMKKYETISDVKQWILHIYLKLIDRIELFQLRSDYSDNITKSMEYIHKNFKRNISLNDVADYIGVNSSYLSRTFKEECGKGFVEYLNFVRVEYVKRMLGDGHARLKDTAVEAGFNNYTYFFKVFKSLTGMTPAEYENSCRT
jgi:two-component system response regulator YesN